MRGVAGVWILRIQKGATDGWWEWFPSRCVGYGGREKGGGTGVFQDRHGKDGWRERLEESVGLLCLAISQSALGWVAGTCLWSCHM